MVVKRVATIALSMIATIGLVLGTAAPASAVTVVISGGPFSCSGTRVPYIVSDARGIPGNTTITHRWDGPENGRHYRHWDSTTRAVRGNFANAQAGIHAVQITAAQFWDGYVTCRD